MNMDWATVSEEILSTRLHQEALYLLVPMLVMTVLLLRFRPEDRRDVVGTLRFFVVSLAGMLLAGILKIVVPGVITAVLYEAMLIATGIAVIKLTGLFVFRIVLPLVRLHTARIVEDIIIIIGYVAWGLVQLRYAGLDLGGIITTSAVITGVIAFSMQDTLGNVMGGLALQLDNSIEVGDWIKVDDLVGRVAEIRWRSTSIETRNGETVVIPNSQLMKNKFTVLGRRAGRPLQWRRWISFCVDYNETPARVISAVENAINQATIPHVAKQPPANCVLMAFESGSGRYALRYWLIDLMHDDATDSAVRTHIYAAMQRAGIRFALTEQSVRVIEHDEQHAEVVKSRELNRRLAALQRVDLFQGFHPGELRIIAERLKYAPFARGAVMTKQGAIAHWLYIMTSGEAEVVLETPDGECVPLAMLPAGSFFGEMGLMTGDPRRASVIARTDVECYRLDKSAFEDVLHSRPDIADEISQILASRRFALERVHKDMTSEKSAAELAQQRNEILEKIKRFFGIGTVH
ncbi:MAG TPA: mechanosensitive ion channel family protein [Burkholderiales bacterium]|nr:mechanosensitive ion channel family protein [Burkholderiales bacterium]